MACNALKQLIADANWGVLDYLLIDLLPGTSDIHLTLDRAIIVRIVDNRRKKIGRKNER